MNRKFSGIFLLLAASVFASGNALAQKKSETKLYKTVIAQGDTLGFNKFLAKYPKSVYAPSIAAKKDSLIKIYNTTAYSVEQANVFFKETFLASVNANAVAGKDFVALPLKKNNIEYITAIVAPAADAPYTFRIVKLKQEGDSWSTLSEKTASRYIQDDELNLFAFVPQNSLECGTADIEKITVGTEEFLKFNYLNYTNATDCRSKWQNNNAELVSNLVSLSDGAVYNAMFSGEICSQTLCGSCNDAIQGGILATEQINYLVRQFASHPALAPANKERQITKEAIKWWYDNNPSGKTTLSFGVLEKEHPIVQAFLNDKYKENSANNSAAFFNIMETTVLCVYNKGSKQYLLAWCEPQAKEGKNAKELGSIYFEKGNTVVLYYYQGNRTSKERINLVTRQKQ